MQTRGPLGSETKDCRTAGKARIPLIAAWLPAVRCGFPIARLVAFGCTYGIDTDAVLPACGAWRLGVQLAAQNGQGQGSFGQDILVELPRVTGPA